MLCDEKEYTTSDTCKAISCGECSSDVDHRMFAVEWPAFALPGWEGPLLDAHGVDDTFDLLDVRPFVAGQPLRVEKHGPYEWLSRHRHCRRT